MNTGKLVDFKLDYCLDVDFKQSEAVSMLLADRIRQLRQEHRWTQAELGQKIKIHQKQISSYERGVNIPSTEVLIKMADIFDVTLDYLALMGIPLTHVRDADIFLPWKIRARPRASITRARSMKWMTGFGPRHSAATISGACAGPTVSFASVAGLLGSLG